MPLSSIIPYDATTDFPVENIPFGAFTRGDDPRVRLATRVGDSVVDLASLSSRGLVPCAALAEPTLNAFLALGRDEWRRVRTRLQDLLSGKAEGLSASDEAIIPASEVTMVLAVTVGDYTDFYASKDHATNVGTMFRGPENALMPNWTHLPVGYHGRASSIVVSGAEVPRPKGQVKAKPDSDVAFMPDPRVDFELEVAAIVGTGNALGDTIPIDRAGEHIFGLSLMNDCSARGIQAYEYVPLGPFLGKNWCTVVSPWIVTMDALEEFRVAAEPKLHPVEKYLEDREKCMINANLSVKIKGDDIAEDTVICQSNLKHLYWSFEQMLAHHSVSGCNMRPGDVLGSGTISGDTKESRASMLELSWKGTTPLEFPNGVTRKFIQDNDVISMNGFCQGDGYRIGFGDCVMKLLPTK